METKRSDSIAQLAGALARAQGEIKTAAKDNIAKVKMKSGGEYSYKYSTLDDIWEACRGPLSKNELSVIQVPTTGETGLQLETLLVHSSGEWVSGTMQLPVVADRMSNLQATGSAITYARRYMLGAIVGVTTGDDDDGEGAKVAERPAQKPANGNGKVTTSPWQRLVVRIKSELDLSETEAKDILKALGFKGFDPAQSDTYFQALDSQLNEAVTTEPALFIVANRQCAGYYQHVEHMRNSIKKVDDGFAYPPGANDVTQWQMALGMLIDHAEANQQQPPLLDAEPESEWDARQDALVNG